MSLGRPRSFDNRSMLRVIDFDASLAALSDASAVHAYCNRQHHCRNARRHPGGTLPIAQYAIQARPARWLITPTPDGASRRTALRPAECIVRASAASKGHSALDGGLTRVELLATGHGEAVRTAAGPAQQPRGA